VAGSVTIPPRPAHPNGTVCRLPDGEGLMARLCWRGRPGWVWSESIVYDGGEVHGLRAGTDYVALAVARAPAAALASDELAHGGGQWLLALRDRLHDRLVERLGDRWLHNGHPHRRLPNTLNASIIGARPVS
jgi:cysteine sulfinate desulfinase/cysteine desulfurase-like protein